ncbi:MAG: M48 family metallopeptidase [Patescibacteria group bacterium]
MTHYQLVAQNKRRSWYVMVGFIIFIVVVVYVMSVGMGFGLDLVGLALIVSGLLSFASYWWSDKIILSLSGARPASREEFFDYYTVTENIVSGQRMPMPRLYVLDDASINAFATGRDPNHGVVVATTGLLARLERAEIEGVVAHELAHIKNYDIRLMSVVTILVGMVALLSDWFLRMSFFGGGQRSNDRGGGQLQIVFFILAIVLAILSPLIAQVIQLAISRKREFLADATGAGMTRNPAGLARALEKISSDDKPLKAASKASAHMYISNPLKNHSKDVIGWFAGLFRTHPPVEERIQALRGLTGKV